MADSVIRRNIDEMGRIVIPKHIRDQLKFNYRDELEITVINNEVRIKKSKGVCSFCGSKKNLIEHMGDYICKSCLSKIREGEGKNI